MREPYLLPVSSTPPAKFFRLSDLRKLRRCEQVAAVCYRRGKRGIEFLLVETDKGRWTFPKGSAEPGLTHAQAAALEAYEEAGVVDGRMEEVAFTSYTRKEGKMRSVAHAALVHAHLCEVLKLDPPLEFKRNPTWFTAEQAKLRLRENRKPGAGSALAQVIAGAVSRIRSITV
ncbi:MAG TPA: NUDIX domain-containing protein [Terriglobales bacterium]